MSCAVGYVASIQRQLRGLSLSEADQAIEPVNLGQPLMAETTLMVIERRGCSTP
jgi:hypothetical protein